MDFENEDGGLFLILDRFQPLIEEFEPNNCKIVVPYGSTKRHRYTFWSAGGEVDTSGYIPICKRLPEQMSVPLISTNTKSVKLMVSFPAENTFVNYQREFEVS